MKRSSYILIFIVAMAICCRKPYIPPEITAPGSYLVVEGVINTGADSTIISLSHTVKLSGKTAVNPQTKATVTVENDQNGSFALTEITPGKYVSPGLNLDNTRQYRLRIKTPDNQQYLSDFVPVKITPPIDSIGFNIDDIRNGLQIYANAHDPKNSTHYYRWDYQETWAFHSKYLSNFVATGFSIVPRTFSQLVYNCYAGAASTNVLIASTTALQNDIVYQAPIALIPSTSEKIETRYSILLHQYALTADAYKFWENLKTNTEQLGGIFDAQPSTSVSNIHNINNPAEIVVGYLSASTVQTKRIFIANSQLPQSWSPIYPYTCSLDSFVKNIPDLYPLKAPEIPLYDFNDPGKSGYIGSAVGCVDCTLRGITKPPSFW